MNYGETLAYWYLRLNGFFPLRNFVLHRLQQPNGRRENADVDLLAIRFPFVHERYGDINDENELRDDDWDSKLKDLLPDLTTAITGLIVEVKTSDPGDLSSFENRRMRADIERLGFFAEKEVIDKVMTNLAKEKVVAEEKYRVGKLLVSEDKREGAWINLTIEEIDGFICHRMKKYSDPKYAARHMFHDDIIQYIIWREKHERQEERRRRRNSLSRKPSINE
jgi:hypothetical protein